jgi:hypothetical protein
VSKLTIYFVVIDAGEATNHRPGVASSRRSLDGSVQSRCRIIPDPYRLVQFTECPGYVLASDVSASVYAAMILRGAMVDGSGLYSAASIVTLTWKRSVSVVRTRLLPYTKAKPAEVRVSSPNIKFPIMRALIASVCREIRPSFMELCYLYAVSPSQIYV